VIPYIFVELFVEVVR